MPSLGTATKLARGLRELRDDADTPQYLRLVSAGATNPTTRVEYALRADEWLSEAQIRQVMEYYLAVRMRRYGRAYAEGGVGTNQSTGVGGASGERNGERQYGAGSSVGGGGRTLGPSSSSISGMHSSGTSAGTAVSTVRSVTRTSSREPGRY